MGKKKASAKKTAAAAPVAARAALPDRTTAQSIQRATEEKEMGNDAYVRGQKRGAIAHWQAAASLLDDVDEPEARELLSKVENNTAKALKELGKLDQASVSVVHAIKANPRWAKPHLESAEICAAIATQARRDASRVAKHEVLWQMVLELRRSAELAEAAGDRAFQAVVDRTFAKNVAGLEDKFG